VATCGAARRTLGTRGADRAIRTHGGNGFALEYGLAHMWWGVRLARTASVSSEMILNYVAERSVGLPKCCRPPRAGSG
jgi:alkylation response protein AidB-like acyl-CoA dehydrogenase